MKQVLLIIYASIICFKSFAQTAAIEGTIKDTTLGEWVSFANVILLKNGNQISATTTDANGKYSLEKIVDGKYELLISYIGYPEVIIDSVQVNSNDNLIINILFPPECKYNNKNGICPVCNKDDEVIPIVYGYPGKRLIKNSNKGKVILGGCNITSCDPDWFCKRDEHTF